MEYYSAIKEPIWVSGREADEPRARYTEWSKSEEEEKDSILTHIYEPRKMVLMNLFSGKEQRETQM